MDFMRILLTSYNLNQDPLKDLIAMYHKDLVNAHKNFCRILQVSMGSCKILVNE